MNCVVLIGRWTKDLELKFLPGNGTATASGTLAVDRRFKKDGQQEADFIPVVLWGKQAETAASYTGKGKLCSVKGRISTRSYDAKDGTKRYVTEVVAEEVQFLEWGEKQSKPQDAANYDFGVPVEDGEIPF